MLDFFSVTLMGEIVVCATVGHVLQRADLPAIASIPILAVVAWALPTVFAFLSYALNAAPKTFGYGEIYLLAGLTAGVLGRYVRLGRKAAVPPDGPDRSG